MGKRVWVLFSLILIASLSLTGCSAPDSADPDQLPLRVEWTTWEGDYTMVIAREKGFFEKHGVRVNPIYYETFSGAVSDLASNRIDAGLFAIGDLLNAALLGDVRCVAIYDSGGTSTVVSRSEINSVSDLRGKRIGVTLSTYNELFVREMLKANGMTVRDVVLVNVDPEYIADRLSVDLDAGYVWAPFDSMAVDKGHKVLYSSKDLGSFSQDVIVFRADVIKERPEEVRAFLNAWFEALDYRLANPEESNLLISKALNLPVEDIASSDDLTLFTRADNFQYFDKNSPPERSIYYATQVNLQFLIDRGNISNAPDLDEILDPSFLREPVAGSK